MTAVRQAVTVPALRQWQIDALKLYFEDSQVRRDFLVTATPGAGKTTFALALAVELVARRSIDRIVVICPTDHLRTQWAQAAERLGLSLDPTLPNSVGPVPSDSLGYITTYAQVAMKPQLHGARISNRRTLVILDEVHHAGDGLSWGDAVALACGEASRRLCLTGTPFRTRADELIPFVRYAADGAGGQESAADFTYGYRDALADGVVRPVVFAAYTGTARWRNSAGEVVASSLTESATKQTEALAWRTALNPRGQWVAHVIAAMDERITHLRASGVPDAAGLVLASDHEDARAYADIVRQITGEEPVLILSDDPKASDKIAAFTVGMQRMAVCVRMVSEGVDVPRAACLAWMTSYRTPLFFAQAVGRVVRARARHESATVFLPAVRPLLTLAASLEEERNHVIPPPAAADDAQEALDVIPPERGEPGERQDYEALDADAQFAHVLHGGRAVVASGEAPREITADDEQFLGLPGLLTPEQTAQLLFDRDATARQRATTLAAPVDEPSAEGGEVANWRAAGELRREVNRLVSIYAARAGLPHAQVHSQIRRAVPGPPSASASAELLEQRRDHLLLLIAR